MAIMTFHDLERTFGAVTVLEGASGSIEAGEKVGLVGPNGSGKTTLLRILGGLAPPDGGRVSIARGTTVGYLPQRPQPPEGLSLRAWVEQSFAVLHAMQARLDALYERVADPAEGAQHDALLEEASELQHELEHRGGYDTERRTENVLTGLGFTAAQLEVEAARLSGGERARGALARLLCEQPDVLLLDEPTNHLDLSMLGWLETWLRDHEQAVIVVSHDRYLLDRVVSRVWSIEGTTLRPYRGAYTAYLHQRRERETRERKERQALREHIAKERGYIRRYKAGQRAREAAGREKRLERLIEESRAILEETPAERTFSFSFGDAQRAGEIVLEARDLGHRYEAAQPLFDDLNVEVRRGDRLGLIGANGCGKTSLLRVVADEIAPSAGHLRRGARVDVGFFRQDTEDLPEDDSVLGATHDSAPREDLETVRGILGHFGFADDEQLKRVGDLSGGERARLALARLFLRRPNLLLLDEPTNHLDLSAREAVEDALLAFAGTVLAVSHDRYFLDRVAGRILAFGEPVRAPEDSRASERVPRVFLGGFTSYHERTEREQRERTAAVAAARSTATKRAAPTPAAVAAPTRRRRRARARRKRFTLEELEARIVQAEEQQEALKTQLGAPEVFRDHVRLREVSEAIEQVATELRELNEEWELWAE